MTQQFEDSFKTVSAELYSRLRAIDTITSAMGFVVVLEADECRIYHDIKTLEFLFDLGKANILTVLNEAGIDKRCTSLKREFFSIFK
jgi:hypothetical protein